MASLVYERENCVAAVGLPVVIKEQAIVIARGKPTVVVSKAHQL